MIVLFRGFYSVYTVVVILLCLSAFSRFIFRKGKGSKKLQQLLEDASFALLFPLMIFSTDGVNRLFKQIKEYS